MEGSAHVARFFPRKIPKYQEEVVTLPHIDKYIYYNGTRRTTYYARKGQPPAHRTARRNGGTHPQGCQPNPDGRSGRPHPYR